MIEIDKGRIRRRDRRVWYLVGGVFVAVFLFTFLVQRNKIMEEDVGAANLAAFDPGYIISDWQMGNYTSMNESQIQNFLRSKNSCNDTYISRYTAGEKVSYFSEMSPPRTWHIKDGHFVCMADEVFEGGTAAHIIYRASQDYRINPRVLLVLLEKEQSLVRDTFPHSQQYRSATGYGCPDTAACSSKYYGLQNQIRNAAALFRTVLDGGWTNYPLGNNYVQYNPNAACGGSIVNIRNRATSALYRYTPYQPNEATLNGRSDGCNAYGNMNFYSLFEDWFGGIKNNNNYINVDTSRYMTVADDTNYIEANTGRELDTINEGTILKFSTKANVDGEWCIRTEEDTRNDRDRCVLRRDLKDLEYTSVDLPRYMILGENTHYINAQSLAIVKSATKGEVLKFTTKILNSNGEWCVRSEDDTMAEVNACIPRKYLVEAEIYTSSISPRYMEVANDTSFVVPNTMEQISSVRKGRAFKFATKIINNEGEWCIRTEADTKSDVNVCIPRKYLLETENYVNSVSPRFMTVTKDTSFVIPHTMEQTGSVRKGQTFRFTTKIINNEGEWCIRTEADTKSDANVCIPRKYLEEANN